MDLRQTLKNGTKILENAIENGSEININNE